MRLTVAASAGGRGAADLEKVEALLPEGDNCPPNEKEDVPMLTPEATWKN